MTTLPPAVRDPSTGKTYIAIRAPSFICNAHSASRTDNGKENNPGYIYVQRRPLPDFSMRRAFTAERDKIKKEVPSVEKWMVGLSVAEYPSGHIPWENHVEDLPLATSTSSIIVRKRSIPQLQLTRCSTLISTKSSSSFEIPLNECGSALLDGSLPSITSSTWSGSLSLPNISKAVERSRGASSTPENSPTLVTTSIASPQVAAPTPSHAPLPALPKIKPLQPHKRYACAPDMPKRREGRVIERRLTTEKTEDPVITNAIDSANSSLKAPMDDMLSQIEAFFTDGLVAMDKRITQLASQKDKLETPPTPSLVVSNSTQVVPISVDAPQSTPPLAVRRGKKVPDFIQTKPKKLSTLAYPEVPTAFRGTPGPGSPSFATEPVYPELTIDMTLSTEQMISSLRAQVESFKPIQQAPARFKEQCDDAYGWFESEIAKGTPSSPLDSLVQSLSKSNLCLSPSPGEASPSDVSQPALSPVDSIRLSKARNSVTLAGSGKPALKGSDIKLPSENLRDWNSGRTKARSATVSGGPITLDGRSVRFSALPPEVIPEDILGKKAANAAATTADISGSTEVESPKTASPQDPDKVVFRQFTQAKKTPSPSKNGTNAVSGRARALSTGSTLVGTPRRKNLPPSPLGQVKPVTLRRLSLLGKKGKENKPLKVVGITFSRRKSLAVDESDGKLKHDRFRSSPLQNVLNRLRTSHGSEK